MAKNIMLFVAAHLCVFLGGPYTRADYLDIRIDLNVAIGMFLPIPAIRNPF